MIRTTMTSMPSWTACFRPNRSRPTTSRIKAAHHLAPSNASGWNASGLLRKEITARAVVDFTSSAWGGFH